MEKEGIINWIDIKKKFDVITETLNIYVDEARYK